MALDALRKLKSEGRFDVVITDYAMPRHEWARACDGNQADQIEVADHSRNRLTPSCRQMRHDSPLLR
jgi:CheY-like chemotaxis protein